MAADIQEVKLNLSLTSPAPSQISSNPTLIGPVIPTHLNSPRNNPYLCSTSHFTSPQNISPVKVKCSSSVLPSVSPPKQSVCTVNNNTPGNVSPSVSSQGVPSSACSPANSLKRSSSKRQGRDVTKSRRYQYSMSFLLGSLNDKDDNDGNNNDKSGPAENEKIGGEKTQTQDEENIRMECSDVVGVHFNEEDVSQRAEPTPTLNNNSDNTSFTPPVTVPTSGNTSKQPLTTPSKLRLSKRPCPHKFAQPTLSKTTSKLFSNTSNNYLKGCKWSPDGLALLTCSRDKTVRIFNAPDVTSAAEQHPTAQHSTANVPYDVEWNPDIDHLAAQNCNFVVSCKDSPVQLVDAFTGNTRASFTAFDSVSFIPVLPKVRFYFRQLPSYFSL